MQQCVGLYIYVTRNHLSSWVWFLGLSLALYASNIAFKDLNTFFAKIEPPSRRLSFFWSFASSRAFSSLRFLAATCLCLLAFHELGDDLLDFSFSIVGYAAYC